MGALSKNRLNWPVKPTPIYQNGSLSRGLQFVSYADHVSTIKPFAGFLVVNTGSRLSGSGFGMTGRRFQGGAHSYNLDAPRTYSGSEGFSVEVLCAITAAPSLSGFMAVGTPGTTVNGAIRGLIAYSGGSNRNIYFWGGSSDLTSGVDWFIDGSLQHVIVTSDGGSGTAMRFYRNGAQIASGTTPTLVTAGAVALIGDTQQTWASSPTGVIFKTTYYSRGLNAGEVARLWKNPMDGWLPPKRRIWAPDTAPATTYTPKSWVPSFGPIIAQ